MPKADRDNRELVKTIRKFCRRHGIAESTFGRHSVNDGKIVGRITNGGWIEAGTERRVREFMDRADRGEIVLYGRPRRKKSRSNAETMSELISSETSVRTAGSFAFHEQRQRFHIFANTTNESWAVADRIAPELTAIAPSGEGIRILYAPMDNGIILTRTLRALHAAFPDTPILVVMKGRGLEDLRNTMGRLVDRMAEHPLSAFILTNMYVREAVELRKISDDNPDELVWRKVALEGNRSYDFQVQVAKLYGDLANEWLIHPGSHGQPVYAKPSIISIYRKDRAGDLAGILPDDGECLRFDYALLNHPYLHSHTMRFRIEHMLGPVFDRLATGGRMTVIQSQGDDPAHEIVRKVWPGQPLPRTSRYEIIRDFGKALRSDGRSFGFTGLTDARSLFRFDMHTLPILRERNLGIQSLSAAFNNAVYFGQVKEELAQAAIREGSRYLQITEDVLRKHGGMWFVNESMSVTRRSVH
ncbi:MAG: hypothetical protein OXI87_20200 [Albidovulum sp.]|nr:hypothetical protein [Albidovulum sp.]MDE0307176.1 hypothetical protein [Albidovulum sp.]MDE0531904.1 hypothetical protein [Albidovulum sp.]